MACGLSRSVPRKVSSTVVFGLPPSGEMLVSVGAGKVAWEKAEAVRAAKSNETSLDAERQRDIERWFMSDLEVLDWIRGAEEWVLAPGWRWWVLND